ncbi:DUF6680 family protein [Roseobacter weihaiensis]|uniref:DUF6680 family protein n=1 Tax=Roseobacter weihaiensis TaxID=2763262 RepID=UPI001D0BB899|nr:DUF6680 family protein [Roseobacter sp. H9]
MTAESIYAALTLLAIVTGPVIAVWLTRLLDARAARHNRRLNLFRDLMQTRGIRLDPLHVAALNIVELEFYNENEVRDAFKAYIDHLSGPAPEAASEQERFFGQRSDLFVALLSKIGAVVGYKFDKHDLDRNSYVPQGWDADQSLQRRNAQLLNGLLSGQRPLPVTNFLSQQSPYPEAPKVDE